jgi:RNA polymerase sigma factor (sigma-70 family)
VSRLVADPTSRLTPAVRVLPPCAEKPRAARPAAGQYLVDNSLVPEDTGLMAPTLTRLLRHLRGLAPPAADSDAALLDRFARARDEAAFAALVARHGPMVLHLCRRVLGDAHAAEDAFQATFLVLARKARSVARPAALAGWLYGVARRVALKARGAARQRPREEFAGGPEAPDPRPDPLAELTARDLLRVVEEEVARLPEAYRLPVALCCLEGLSLEEAARRLDAAPGSVRARLGRGRKRLRDRLSRRGLTLSAALAAAEVSRAAVAGALRDKAVAAALAAARGKAAVASPNIHDLAEGVMRAMALKQGKMIAAVVLTLGLLGAGTGVLALRLSAGEAPAAQGTGERAAEPVGERKPADAAARGKAKAEPADMAQAARQLGKARDALAEASNRYGRLIENFNSETTEARLAVAEAEERLRALERRRAAERAREDRALQAAEEALRQKPGGKENARAQELLASLEAKSAEREEKYLGELIDLRLRLTRKEEKLRALERGFAPEREIAEARVREAVRWVLQAERRLQGEPEPAGNPGGLEGQLDALRRELAELRRAVEKLGRGRPAGP